MKSDDSRIPLQKRRSKYYHPVWIFLSVFLPFCVVLFTFHFYIYNNKKDFIRDSLERLEWHEVAIFAESLEEHFEWLVNDLNFVASLYRDSTYAKRGDTKSCDDLIRSMLIFSRESKVYDQIRFIDSTGVERIRINYNNGKPVSVPAPKLQDKKDRYYIEQIRKIEMGKVYLSPFDLNVEYGEVELPYKPVLRVAVSVPDAFGEPGIISFNYYGAHLLQHIREQHAQGLPPDLGKLSLLNGDGYWLLASDPVDEWGFMFDDKKQRTMDRRYPKEWASILAGENGSFATPNGLFTYTTVRPNGDELELGDDYFWKLVSRLPLDKADSMLVHEQYQFVLIGILLLFLSAILAVGGMFFYQRKRMYEDELMNLASSDPLTGLFNRRAFLERLLFEKNRFDRNGGSLVLVMADVDYFKQVNDQHGHDAGDYILRMISKILQTRMRLTDVLCRWGGEEFMLLLADNRELDGRNVAEKVRAIVEAELFTFDGRNIPITMSFGVADLEKGMTVEQCIQLADQRLYYSKQNGRNCVTSSEQGEIVNVEGER